MQVACKTVLCDPRLYELKGVSVLNYHFVIPVCSHVSSAENSQAIPLYVIYDLIGTDDQVANLLLDVCVPHLLTDITHI